jgi:hypothetical protein
MNTPPKNISSDDYMGCFGDFSIKDPVCRMRCALSLRCVIERDHNDQMEILEDIFFDTLPSRIQ